MSNADMAKDDILSDIPERSNSSKTLEEWRLEYKLMLERFHQASAQIRQQQPER